MPTNNYTEEIGGLFWTLGPISLSPPLSHIPFYVESRCIVSIDSSAI